VILFVGDGMGISTITAAHILERQRRGPNQARTIA
jgi:alkaline phosphatase